MLPTIIAVVLGALALIAALCAAGLERRRTRALAARVARDVEPLLRRKAAEAGLDVVTQVWTARSTAEDIVGFSAELAKQLLELERAAVPGGIGSDTALAQTVPMDAGDLE